MGRSIRPYDEGDVMAFCFSAGGAGYGDPLEADPEEVARDFAGGLISAWTMREIYKVAYDEVERGRAGRARPRRCAPTSARRARRATRDWATFEAAVVAAVAARGPARLVRLLARGHRGGAGHADVNALDDALAGDRVDRPLRAPLFAALAAEVEELDVREFLADPGRRARIYADLARSLRPDVLVVDSGSGWDAEAAGWTLDWSRGYPPSIGWASASPRPSAGDPAPMLDLLRRVRAVVPEPTLLGVDDHAVRPPTPSGRARSPTARGVTIAYARGVAEAGAGVVFVRESGAEPPDGYARAVTPLWGALKFFRAVGVLRAPWAADAPARAVPAVRHDATRAPARAGRRARRGARRRTRRRADHPHRGPRGPRAGARAPGAAVARLHDGALDPTAGRARRRPRSGASRSATASTRSRRCSAGRSTISRGSGRRSGTSSSCGRRRRTSGCSGRAGCRAPSGSRARGSTTPSTCWGVTTRRRWPSSRARTRAGRSS